ncbi:MAG: preprotein translocase subunit YajC [Bacillaceae bacterium]
MAQLFSFLPLILVFVIFYFMLIRPQQKRQKEQIAMQNALVRGDKVVTIGGLHGTVDSVSDITFVLKAGDGSRLTFDKASVREVTQKVATAEVTEEQK